MSAQIEEMGEWQMGGSADPALAAAYGVTEAEIAAIAVDAIFYAQAKAGASRGRFVTELVMEFEALVSERMGLTEDE